MRHKCAFAAAVLLLGGSMNLNAQGRVIVPHHPVPWEGPVSLREVDASVTLRRGVAAVTLDQHFYNGARRPVEGEYHFSLPWDAHIQDFSLYVNGKKTGGELVEAEKARRIYEDIVRSRRDPALLEFADNGLYRTRIFPIPAGGERRIELAYTAPVAFESGTYRFVLPIRQSGQGSIERYHLSLELEAEAALGNIYSPSHKIAVVRDGPDRARVSLEQDQMEADRDFILYYGLANPGMDLTLLTYRPRTDRDGYFMLLANPDFRADRRGTAPRDVIFLIDQSGSMNGEKLQQARGALDFCVTALNPHDRFEIIGFSSTVSGFQDGLHRADGETVENARAFIRSLEAAGGTDIDGALRRALALKTEADRRPTSIIFLTDGLPTEGEVRITTIVKNLAARRPDFVRIFSFGVGFDVNTYLLDRLSRDSHGTTHYVRPGENIEAEVTRFFAKLSSPALRNPAIQWGRSRAHDVYPGNLGDVFSGHRSMIVGRYRAHGPAEIRLSGIQGDESREFTLQADFARRDAGNDFIAGLWANRKVVSLLDQIRFDGENDELVQSIRQLGEEYGIVTPYTSYLVTEQEQELVAGGRDPGGQPLRPDIQRLRSRRQSREARAEGDDEDVGSKAYYAVLKAPSQAPAANTGRAAVLSSRILSKLNTAEQEVAMMLTVRRVGGRTFRLKAGVWLEAGLQMTAGPDRVIPFLGEEYFALSREHRDVNSILALGERIRFKWQGRVLEVIPSG